MDQKFIDFKKTIKKKHSVRFTPRYVEVIQVSISQPRILTEIAVKAVEALEWELIYQDDETVEARQSNGRWSGKYAITIKTGHPGEVEVKSESTGDEMWDMGNNSKRVKLFLFAFTEILNEQKQSNLADLKKEIERKDKMSDYVIPKTLPEPPVYKDPNSLLLWLGFILSALFISLPLAFLASKGIYILGLFELGAIWLLAYTAGFLFRISNFTDWKTIHKMLILTIAVIFICNLFYQYLFYMNDSGDTLNFMDYVTQKIEAGIQYKNLNLGSIGLLIVWVISIGLLYILGRLLLLNKLIRYVISKVPEEVTEFAVYYFAQKKDEAGVKSELTKMGWNTEQEHEMVFEALDGFGGMNALQRMK